AQPRRPHRRDHVVGGERADCAPRALERVPARRHRLAEDAQPRARPSRHHRQLRRAGSDRDGAPRRALPGRSERRRPARDRARPLGRAARARRRRLLPRLGARPLRHRTDDRRRRRALALPLLTVRQLALLVTPARLGGLLVAGAAATLAALYLIPSDDYLLLPDPAHPVAPLVEVQGGHDPRGPGGVYFVDVLERRASTLESLLPWLHPGGTLVPARLIVPPGVSDEAARQADLREMSISQKVAAAVALRRLGYRVAARPDGVIVSVVEVGTHAEGRLQPADVIVSVDRTPTPTVAALRRKLAQANVGQVVALGVRRGGRRLTVRVETVADPL